MDAPERGALMLVRFIAACAHGRRRWLDLALYWVVSAQHTPRRMKIFPCVLKSIPVVHRRRRFDQGQGHREWISDKLDE